MPRNEAYKIDVESEGDVTEVNNGSDDVTMSFHNITYEVEYKLNNIPCSKPGKKVILKDISGIMAPGLCAIMGPTGSGKTSLLDILAGRKDPKGIKNGKLLMNGREVKQDKMRLSTGYVVQDDIILGTLTVRENLLFSANMRLPASKFTAKDRAEKVEQIIKDLGLMECANTKVGNELIRGVSGGERKRTSIGMELLIDPPVLFLDEPTTGLDAYTAGSIMRLLSNMGRKGRTIIVSIHQPRYSIFSLFDQLLILSRGDIVYNGPCIQSVEYFGSIGFQCPRYHNPADYILDVVNGEIKASDPKDEENECTENGAKKAEVDMSGDTIAKNLESERLEASMKLVSFFKNSSINEEENRKIKEIEAKQIEYKNDHHIISHQSHPNGFFHQLKYLIQRTFLDLVRNPITFAAAILMNIVIALIVGLIFFQLDLTTNGIQDRAGGLFFLVTVNVMNNIPAVDIFIQKRKIFIHESASGYYRTSSYFISRVLADILPFRWIPVMFLTIIVYFMMGLQMDAGKFFFFLLVLAAVTTVATALAFTVSSSFLVATPAMMMLILPFMIMLLFSGFLVNTSSLLVWLEWIKWFSLFRYGVNGLLVNEFSGLVFIGNSSFPGYEPNSPNPCFSDVTRTRIPECTTGEEYLERQNIPIGTWGLWQNIVALAVMATGYFILAFIQLLRSSIYK